MYVYIYFKKINKYLKNGRKECFCSISFFKFFFFVFSFQTFLNFQVAVEIYEIKEKKN